MQIFRRFVYAFLSYSKALSIIRWDLTVRSQTITNGTYPLSHMTANTSTTHVTYVTVPFFSIFTAPFLLATKHYTYSKLTLVHIYWY